ncbi:acyl carrier protein [Nocardiopsis sp. YSL2]|uniref:acyl carrier protein n=1 Tax=Nocardiopsis sp. YSL2 TaxID=2939492 RepID=UPI0026F4786D|nr:acyl carrier protein [Nocardiopsis sp. YSL2]
MNDRKQIAELVSKHIATTIPELSDQEVPEDKDLREFAGFDSLGILESLVWLESEFGITIPDEELTVEKFSSVTKMVDYVIDHRG